MGRWYTTREQVKLALGEQAPSGERDKVIDEKIEAASREIERLTHRIFIPRTQTRYFPYPYRDMLRAWQLPLDEDLLSVTTLTKDDDTATAIANTDYFLEPANYGPPYHTIEIDLASAAFFSNLNTHQRAVRVTGLWGYCNDTVAAGALAGAVSSTSTTSIDVTDSSLVGIGDTLLIDSEQMFVTTKALLTTGTTLNDNSVTQNKNNTTITVASGSAIKQGEIITIGSERMYVEAITGNNLIVVRAYDGSVLNAHSTGGTVYAPRTLTVERAAGGTTAATHLISTAINRYRAPLDIINLCEALSIFEYIQSRGGRTGVIGANNSLVMVNGRTIETLTQKVRSHFVRNYVGAA